MRHARRLVFQFAEVIVPRMLFQGVLDRIGRLCPVPAKEGEILTRRRWRLLGSRIPLRGLKKSLASRNDDQVWTRRVVYN